MGALIRAYDWKNHPLGHPDTWPQSLLTTVSIILNSRFPMFLWWGPEHYQFYNDAYRPSLGREGKHPTALGQKGVDCWPEVWSIIYPLMRQVIDGGGPTWQEDALIPIYRNGQIEDVYWTFSYSPVRGDTGNIDGILVVCTETTRSVQSFRQLREMEQVNAAYAQRLEIALEAAQLGSFEFDLQTMEITCNEQCRLHLGLPPAASYRQQEMADILNQPDRAEKAAAWQHAVRNRETYRSEYQVRQADGSIRYVIASGNTMYNEDGQPAKMVGVTMDVTEHKLFTQRLSTLVSERTYELQRSNDDLLQFAHITSHDLKEPVRKVKVWSSRLEQDGGSQLSEQGRFYLQKVQHASDRIQLMIDGILAYSAASSSEQMITAVDLNEVLQHILDDMEILLHDKRASVQVGPLPVIQGASVLLYQVFYNLIYNSLKFAQKDTPPEITITATEQHLADKKWVAVTVRDNGIGFEPAYNSKIFIAFTRLNSKDAYEGTGLGLALCQRVAQRHGGSITAEGVPGEGATFRLLLPVVQENNKLQHLI